MSEEAIKSEDVIEVSAPSNLQEGHILPVTHSGNVVNVTVPEGGVKAGEVFKGEVTKSSLGTSLKEIPTGKWRDGLCSCCAHGPCHPMLCNAWLFPLIALGQIMTRLNLNWLAIPGDASGTFRIVLTITLIFLVFDYSINVIMLSFGYERHSVPLYVLVPSRTIGIIYLLYTIYILVVTRMYMRRKYHIPAKCCASGIRGCEDVFCAICCQCCAVAQMGRHNANYEDDAAYCCSNNGLSPSKSDLNERNYEARKTDNIAKEV